VAKLRRKRHKRKVRCHVPRSHKRRRKARKRRCAAPKRHRRRPIPKKVVPRPAVQPVPPPPARPAAPGAPSHVSSPVPTYKGTFGVSQAERLLWRAGFGPSPGHAQALAGMGLEAAVLSLSRPSGAEQLVGAAPRTDAGDPLSPEDAWGHDALWFLDRMVRSDQPLVERMTLIWHDWFATSNEGVGSQKMMLDQNQLFRTHSLGSFQQLALDVTGDPAMILWLNLNENTRWDPNENYARELMELFTLGADRGAYTETDVRELARALTGWRNDWSSELGNHNFRFDPTWHDPTSKTVFGRSGTFDWRDAIRLCVEHSLHPSYFVQKLWGYFIPTPPSSSDRTSLEDLYRANGYAIRPVVEAILMHPDLHTGPRMVKPPAVYVAGLLRTLRRSIDTEAWAWLLEGAGQQLFYPPNVSGWDDSRWLDTSTIRGRWDIANYALAGLTVQGGSQGSYDDTETPRAALDGALAFWSDPGLTPETEAALLDFATTCLPASMATWEQHTYRALRQNALRQLIPVSPDLQTC
jgi:Protein of unknown function (DUF1800)